MRLFLVVPCYNEEEALPETARRLREKVRALAEGGRISEDSRIVFVNDGSKDRTWEIIRALHADDPTFRGVCLSRNRGHQNALLAGLLTVRDECDAAVSLDADLQDDVDAIDEMVDRFAEGADVVYGVRSSRKRDSLFKRATAQGFYRLMRAMGAETVYNHADFRLMSRRALDALAEFGEVNLFLRGIVPLVGFPSAIVRYERGKRLAGKSKYPLRKMLALASEGVTSLSVRPLRLITALGTLVLLAGLGMLIYAAVRRLAGYAAPGWPFLLSASLWGLSGVQLLSLGVVGSYVGRIYLEAKRRPRYIISEYLRDP